MRTKLIRLAAAIMLNAVLADIARAVPLGILVQGYLTNSAGTPYTTPQQAEFKLFQGGTAGQAGSGSLAYDETASVTPAASGVFTYLLGSGSRLTPALSTATFDASPLFVEISVGGSVLLPRLQLTGSPYAAVAGVAESLKPTAQLTTGLLTASSATIGGLQAAAITVSGDPSQPSLILSSSVFMTNGGLTAPFVSAGAFFGDGSHLRGVAAASVAPGDMAPGILNAGVQVPAASLINGPIAASLLPPTAAVTNAANTFGPQQSFPGGLSGSSGTFSGAMSAPLFSGAFKGDGSQLTGVSATNVGAANVLPGVLPSGVQLPAGGVMPGTLGAGVQLPAAGLTSGTLSPGVLLPTQQLMGPPIAPALLVATVAYTTNANNWLGPQTISNTFTIAPAAGALARVGGVYSGPTTGYSGIGQETSRHQLVFPSWSNVANDTLGVKLMGINKTAYPTAPWYLAQTSELHIGLLTRGALSSDDTLDLFQFTPSGLSMSGALTATSAAFSGGVSATTAAFTGPVSASLFIGAFKGDGSQITGVSASNVGAANVTAGTFGVGVLLPTQQLTGPAISPSLLVSTVAYTTNANTFGPAQAFPGGISGSTGTFSGTMTAPLFNGAHKGDGSQLTGVAASAVGAANVLPGTLPAGVLLPANGVLPGTLSAGVILPTQQLTGAPISPSLLVSTLAYTTTANTFGPLQTFQNGLAAGSGAFSGLITANAFKGDGSQLTGVLAAAVNAANVTPGTLPSGVILPPTNLGPGALPNGVLLPTQQLSGAPIAPSLLVSTLAYTTNANAFGPTQTFNGGISGTTGTFSGQVNAQAFNGTHKGDGSQLTGVAAASVAANNVTSGTLPSGVLLPAGQLAAGTVPAGVLVPAANLTPGTLPAGVTLPTQQLSGAPISTSLLVSTLAYTTNANTWLGAQTIANSLTLAPPAGALERIGGVYSGPTSGYSGIGQETSRHQLVFPSWSNVANDTLGVKFVAVNKTAYPTPPWYLSQTSELHISLLTHGALSGDDTQDLFQFTPSGLGVGGLLTAHSGAFTYGIAATTGTFSGTVTANSFQGNGSALTGVAAANVPAGGVTAGTFGAGVFLPTQQLTGGAISPSLLPSALAYSSNANAFGPTQSFANGFSASTGSFSGPVTAQSFTGAHNGSGAGLTGVPTASLVGGPISPSLFPATVGLGNALKSNLSVRPNAGAPLNKVDISADLLSVQGVSLSNINVTVNTQISGAANGIDAGSLAGSSWYAVFVITNDQGSQAASLMSLSSVPMQLPSGYTRYRRVGWININGGGNVVQFQMQGDWWTWTDGTQFQQTNPPQGTNSFAAAMPPTSRLGNFSVQGAGYPTEYVYFKVTGTAMPPILVGGMSSSAGGAASNSAVNFATNAQQQIEVSYNYNTTIVVLGYYDPI